MLDVQLYQVNTWISMEFLVLTFSYDGLAVTRLKFFSNTFNTCFLSQPSCCKPIDVWILSLLQQNTSVINERGYENIWLIVQYDLVQQVSDVLSTLEVRFQQEICKPKQFTFPPVAFIFKSSVQL